MRHRIDTGFLVAVEVAEHPCHQAARLKLQQFRAAGDRLALAPQVLAEFVHVVTDPKRFGQPLTMEAALARAEIWWGAPEVDQIGHSALAMRGFFAWMRQYKLGRKRILDTLLAAVFREAGIRSVLTTNSRDFSVLGSFDCITP